MPAKVFCMASAKGGSGKTVLTATFGAFLAAIGKKVLLVDTDASTNGLTLLYLKEVMQNAEIAVGKGRKPKGTYEITEQDWQAEVVQLSTGAVLIPATYNFMNTDLSDANNYGAAIIKFLSIVREGYDFIFLDAQAGSDSFASIAMSRRVSDEVVIVSEYDPMSAAGVERLKGLFREDLTYDRTWVLLNKLLPEFLKSFSEFLEVAKYLSPLPWNADVVRAYARRKLALNLEEGNEYTLAVINTLRVLLGDLAQQEIDLWVDFKAAELRRPFKIQYDDLERELTGLTILERDATMRTLVRTFANQTVRFAFPVVAVATVMYFYLRFDERLVIELYKTVGQSESGFITLMVFAALAVLYQFAKKAYHLTEYAVFGGDRQQLFRKRIELEEKLKRLKSLQEADLELLVKSK